jgi:ribosomal protein S18 acetylase RimI-like enzyme
MAQPGELLRATVADDNLLAHATAATRTLPGARLAITSDLAMVDSGLPCDTFNFICRSRLSPKAAAGRIGDALDFFAVTGHPFSWWLTPGHSPVDLPDLLESAGLQAAESELAMALVLSDLAEPEAATGLEIRRIRVRADLDAYARLSAANWSPPDQQVISYFSQTAATFLAPGSEQWIYLGLVDGEPVATAELTVGGGVVGLYNISTVPSYRGRGIGSAMTAAPLLEARSAGHRTAILQAAPDGVRIYQRLGFRQFGTITEYKPPAS